MRESEFWTAVDWTFPGGRGRSLMQDLVLSSLDGRSPLQAIDAGVNPQRVWNELCTAMDLPDSYRFIHRVKPEDRDDLTH
ncbi:MULTISPECIES: DUF3046 domain-containing protein [unclassified Actinobaculum]|uniref:DUF3046 domain-containing protein n=1 Tax=unclassified Actinobaculum TaxID=2609299 RepID=UPI000D5286CE|nr:MULTISPECIES: DUF3046 domain-containing protein [unclassified Actinobaculum]AWE42620.1 DUF3046 domain-containing protein [Actinobaculum sp. 313]RTE47958.1 DUF3046 domain-containing protein [Actinobaculum sp. 352]